MKFDIAEFGFCKDKNEINLYNVLPINRRKMSNAAKFIYTSISGFGNLTVLLFLLQILER